MILASQISDLRAASKLSQRALAERAATDPRVIAGLERGEGTMESLIRVAAVLSHYPTPYPSALASKRRWLGLSISNVAAAAGITRRTLVSLETTGNGRVESFEGVCKALDEQPRLAKIEPAWWTPRSITDGILAALNIDAFCLDPSSSNPPTVSTRAHYTERDGGLWHQWHGRYVWLNPPYDQIPTWGHKALAELESGRARSIIALLPHRAETNFWRTIIDSGADILILHKRLTFGGRAHTALVGSAIICWNLTRDELSRVSKNLPDNSLLRLESVI